MIFRRKSFRMFFEELSEIRLVAQSLAFSTLLSIIPFLIIILAVFQYFGGLEEYYHKVEIVLFSNLKEATGSTVSKFLRTALEGVDFGALGVSGAIALIWTSTGLIRNIDYAFNRIWKIKIESSIYKRLLIHWLVLIAVPVALAMFVAAKSIFFTNEGRRSIEYQAAFALFLWLFIFVLYKIIPETKVNSWPAVIASAVSGFCILVVQKSFLWLSAIVFSHNQIYGSLASFPIFLIWLLIIWYVVLLGVSLCAFLQQKSFKRS